MYTSYYSVNTNSVLFKWHSNNGPFSDWTTFDYMNTILVQYSDPHCMDMTE